jgi:hypothetical protein
MDPVVRTVYGMLNGHDGIPGVWRRFGIYYIVPVKRVLYDVMRWAFSSFVNRNTLCLPQMSLVGILELSKEGANLIDIPTTTGWYESWRHTRGSLERSLPPWFRAFQSPRWRFGGVL